MHIGNHLMSFPFGNLSKRHRHHNPRISRAVYFDAISPVLFLAHPTKNPDQYAGKDIIAIIRSGTTI
jgi:hypothetical protein